MVLVVPVVGVLLLAAIWGLQRHLGSLPATAPVSSAEAGVPGARDAVLHTSDGLSLGAWFVPAQGHRAARAEPGSGRLGARRAATRRHRWRRSQRPGAAQR